MGRSAGALQGPGMLPPEISLLRRLRLKRTRKCLSRTARRTVCGRVGACKGSRVSEGPPDTHVATTR